MRKIEKSMMYMVTCAKMKLNEFLYEENGDVNIVSMVVLVGIAVLLAVMFRKQIGDLIDKLFITIGENATNAIN